MSDFEIKPATRSGVIPLQSVNVAKFNSMVQKGKPDECWTWMGGKFASGYGQFCVAGKVRRAHRVAFLIAHGEIPRGLDVLHECDNPPCCNPGHLRPGTHLDNMRDMAAKGRCTPCRGDNNGARLHPELMPVGEAHGLSKLTDESVISIREMASNRIPHKSIASAFGVTRANVNYIVNRKTWRHVK